MSVTIESLVEEFKSFEALEKMQAIVDKYRRTPTEEDYESGFDD